MKITSVSAQQVLDTRDKPTVEATLVAGELVAHASVPSGKSTGSHEAKELRDADGGVATAIANVEGEIATLLTSREWSSADEIDAAMIALDGTPDKSRLGANAILGVSIAAQRLFAQKAGVPLWKAINRRMNGEDFSRVGQVQRHPATPSGGAGLSETLSKNLPRREPGAPRLYLNFMNGGVHADFKLPFQEYIFVAEGKTSEAMPAAEEVFKKLGEKLGDVPMGDEGGYAPTFDTLEKPFELLAEAVAAHPSASIAIDAAASEFYEDGAYTLLGKHYSASELTTIYRSIVERFPMHSIEDPFFEDAAADFAALTAAIGEKVIIIGDDFTTTNPARIEMAREAKAITGVLIKPNQIGSVKEAIDAVQMTHANGWAAVCSHRSGETDDTFIADFAYGVGAHGIKAGGLGQRQRLEKYARLLEIEREAEGTAAGGGEHVVSA